MFLCKYVNLKYDLETKDCLTITIKLYIRRSIKENFFSNDQAVQELLWKPGKREIQNAK